MLKLKKTKGADYVIGRNSRGLFKSKLHPVHGAFLPNRKYFGYKMGIRFNNIPLVLEQNNYATKIVNACIVCDTNR